MKKFNYVKVKSLIDLTTEMNNGKRFYVTPEGKYPSVTSVLSAFPKPELLEWRKRVGEEEANKISKIASSRGTKFHTLCEKYLSNEIVDNKLSTPDAFQSFLSIKKYLNQVNNIHFLECPLYSSRLKIAGRSDLIAEFNNTLSLIDFKTSKKEKKKDYIEDYFIQATAYHMMYWELTGIQTKQLVILIAVDEGNSQVFIEDPKKYIPKLIRKVKDYYQFYHK